MWFNVTVIPNHKVKPFCGNLGGGSVLSHRLLTTYNPFIVTFCSMLSLKHINTNLKCKLLKVVPELLESY